MCASRFSRARDRRGRGGRRLLVAALGAGTVPAAAASPAPWQVVAAACTVDDLCPALSSPDARLLCAFSQDMPFSALDGLSAQSPTQVQDTAEQRGECFAARTIQLWLEAQPCADGSPRCQEVQVWRISPHPAQGAPHWTWSLAPDAALQLEVLQDDRVRVRPLPGAQYGEGSVQVHVAVPVYGGEASATADLQVALYDFPVPQLAQLDARAESIWEPVLDRGELIETMTGALLTAAERELREWALRALQARICGEMAGLLPRTCATLSASHTELMLQSTGALQALQAALQEDIVALPAGLAHHLAEADGQTPRDFTLVLGIIAEAAAAQEGPEVVAALVRWSGQVAPQVDRERTPAAAALWTMARVLAAMVDSEGRLASVPPSQQPNLLRALLLDAAASGWPAGLAVDRRADAAALARALAQLTASLDASPALPDLLAPLHRAAAADLALPAEVSETLEVCQALAEGIEARRYRQIVYNLGRLVPLDLEALQILQEGALLVAEASTPEELAQALSLWVTPPGMSAIKRSNPAWGIGPNAYVGGGAGREVPGGDRESASGAVWLSIPLGIEAGRQYPLGYIGVLVPLLDLGAAWQLRLDSTDGVETADALRLRQLFAPGLYGVYGIPETPLSVGLGTSVVQDLRVIEIDGQDEAVNARRLGVMVGVDLPIRQYRWYPGQR